MTTIGRILGSLRCPSTKIVFIAALTTYVCTEGSVGCKPKRVTNGSKYKSNYLVDHTGRVTLA